MNTIKLKVFEDEEDTDIFEESKEELAIRLSDEKIFPIYMSKKQYTYGCCLGRMCAIIENEKPIEMYHSMLGRPFSKFDLTTKSELKKANERFNKLSK